MLIIVSDISSLMGESAVIPECKIALYTWGWEWKGRSMGRWTDDLLQYLILEHSITSDSYERKRAILSLGGYHIILHNTHEDVWRNIKNTVKKFADKNDFLVHKDTDTSIEIKADIAV